MPVAVSAQVEEGQGAQSPPGSDISPAGQTAHASSAELAAVIDTLVLNRPAGHGVQRPLVASRYVLGPVQDGRPEA